MIKFFKRISFQLKILICSLLISVIALAIFSIFATHLLADSVQTNATESAQNELELLNLAFDDLIVRVEDHSRILSSNVQLQASINTYLEANRPSESDIQKTLLRPRILGVISDVVSPTSQFLGCLIFYDGEVIFSSMGMAECGAQDHISQDHLDTVIMSQKAIWQKELFQLDSSVRKEPINLIAISKKIIDKSSGRNLGIVTLFLDERTIAELYEDTPNGLYYLVDSAGSIISASNESLLYTPLQSTYEMDTGQFQQLQEAGHILLPGDGGEILLTAVQNENLGWWLVKCTDLSVIQDDQVHIRGILWVVLLITVLAAFILLWIMSNSLTKPVAKLVDVMQKIDGQHTSLRAPQNLSGEMGMLANGFNQLMDKLEKNMQEIKDAQALQRANELRLLQEQIQPHFLYNTLQTLSALVKSGESDLALSGIHSLADFYKYSLSRGDDIITIGDELSLIKNYLSIQQLRYVEYIEFYIDAEEEILNYAIPKLTLQPLVENAIYHGLKPQNEKGMLMVHGFESEDTIVLEIMDTGVGMREDIIKAINAGSPPSVASFGIRNVLQRLQLLYGNDVSIHVTSRPTEFTTVTVTIQNPKTAVEE